MTDSLSGALDALYATLHTLQKPDGSFESMSVHDDVAIPSPTIFSTAIVLSMLPNNQKEGAETMIAKSIAYIQQQQKETGSWNYWKQHQSEKQQYPDDLDDTTVCFAALSKHAPDLVTGAMIARLAHILNACEHDEGGPYNTWITDWQYNEQFSDIDLAVNANIAFCLAQLGVQLPKLTELFQASIAEQDYYSEYYCSAITIVYFIARANAIKTQIDSSATEQLLQYIISHDACVRPSNTFETACAISAFLLLASDITKQYYEKRLLGCVHFLTHAVQTNQCVAVPWYREQETKEALWYCQSTAITIAACIEALTLYKTNTTAEHILKNQKSHIVSSIAIEHFLQTIPHENNTDIITLVQKSTNNAFVQEMISLPFHMATTLAVPFPEQLLENLAVATTAGWVGYSIIDSIMDHQESATLLPFAINCIRSLQTIYSPYNHIAGINETLQTIEHALSNEYRNRLQSYSTGWIIPHTSQVHSLPLYEKSLGVTLPIFILCALAEVSPETTTSCIHFFRHYLSVRQRTDDAHDIVEDLVAGRQTPLIALLLRHFQKAYPERLHIHTAEDTTALLKLFWQDCFLIIQQENANDIVAMETIIANLPDLNTAYFNECVLTLKKQANHITKEYDTIRSFLSAY